MAKRKRTESKKQEKRPKVVIYKKRKTAPPPLELVLDLARIRALRGALVAGNGTPDLLGRGYCEIFIGPWIFRNVPCHAFPLGTVSTRNVDPGSLLFLEEVAAGYSGYLTGLRNLDGFEYHMNLSRQIKFKIINCIHLLIIAKQLYLRSLLSSKNGHLSIQTNLG